ncbi:MAG: hypothetical protein RQM90_02545 [Methanoculleus sp.]
MVVFEPEKGAADEERSDLVSSEVEDVTLPLRMVALTGKGVLVEVGTPSK